MFFSREIFLSLYGQGPLERSRTVLSHFMKPQKYSHFCWLVCVNLFPYSATWRDCCDVVISLALKCKCPWFDDWSEAFRSAGHQSALLKMVIFISFSDGKIFSLAPLFKQQFVFSSSFLYGWENYPCLQSETIHWEKILLDWFRKASVDCKYHGECKHTLHTPHFLSC